MTLDLFRLPRADQPRWIAERLAVPAPAEARGLSDGFRLPGRDGAVRPAAVLVPIVDRESGPTVLLTQRSSALRDHPGQISFPGGSLHADDDGPRAAALREAEEEVGLASDRISLLGELADYETVTGFRVTPVVGWVEPPFDLRLDPVEVADAFEVPLAFLLDPANRQRQSREWQGETRWFYAMPYREHYIWGATAGMLVNLSNHLSQGRL